MVSGKSRVEGGGSLSMWESNLMFWAWPTDFISHFHAHKTKSLNLVFKKASIVFRPDSLTYHLFYSQDLKKAESMKVLNWCNESNSSKTERPQLLPGMLRRGSHSTICSCTLDHRELCFLFKYLSKD